MSALRPLLAALALVACSTERSTVSSRAVAPAPVEPAPVEPAPVEPAPAEPAPAEPAPAEPARPERDAARIRFEPAPEGDLPPIVIAFADRARAEGRVPLVYVGATWCEPCRYFHAAAERGELDGELPPLALLELDRDRDGARIDAAGYGSRMIPLFAVPGEDGRGTGAQIEGSIHGPGSPMQIVPRLRALIAAR